MTTPITPVRSRRPWRRRVSVTPGAGSGQSGSRIPTLGCASCWMILPRLRRCRYGAGHRNLCCPRSPATKTASRPGAWWQAMPRKDVYFVPDLAQATRFLLDGLRSGDVVLVLSAGDADQISTDVLEQIIQPSYGLNGERWESTLCWMRRERSRAILSWCIPSGLP